MKPRSVSRNRSRDDTPHPDRAGDAPSQTRTVGFEVQLQVHVAALPDLGFEPVDAHFVPMPVSISKSSLRDDFVQLRDGDDKGPAAGPCRSPSRAESSRGAGARRHLGSPVDEEGLDSIATEMPTCSGWE